MMFSPDGKFVKNGLDLEYTPWDKLENILRREQSGGC